MPSFLEDITSFYGDNGINAAGDNLEEFLRKYNHGDYDSPSVTADVLVFRMKQEGEPVPENVKLLMIRRANHPCIHSWALPGGFVDIREDAADAAKRELTEETGLTGIPLEQLNCFANYDRDPRWRLVTISFLALLMPGNCAVSAGDDAADAAWMDVKYEKESEREEAGKRHTVYRIYLDNFQQDIHLDAAVEVSVNIGGYIRERTLTVVENHGIAFDHPRFIVDALQTLLGRLTSNCPPRTAEKST